MRRLSEDDEALYCGLYTDADTMRFIDTSWTSERAVRTFRKMLARSLRQDGPRYFVVTETAAQNVAGLCAIQSPDADRRHAEVGIMLKSEARVLGYATETMAAVLTFAFSALPIDTVWVQYHPANTAAERLFTGLGFLPQVDVPIGDVRQTQCIRSIRRSAWGALSTYIKRGEDNVERHQFS